MSESKPLEPDQLVAHGRFVLAKRLGRGGMGEVWLARDERLQEQVALKFLPPEIRDPTALEGLRRETARSHHLSHPNIVRLHDLHEDPDGTAFIVMEYIDGPTLAGLRLQQPCRVLSWDYLRPLVEQLCAALHYAHSERVIHRDLKPANMMVDGKGRLKLADFGIAAMTSDSASPVAQQHANSGTLPYMSPQQLAGKWPEATDDIYALGATLYELLTSQPPFHTGDVHHQIWNQAPEPMDERQAALGIDNAVPPDVRAMVMACLAKKPEQRPQSARAVAEWIGLELDTKPSTESLAAALFPQTPSNVAAVGDEPKRKGRSTPAGYARKLVSVGIVVLVMAGAIWLRRGHPLSPDHQTSDQAAQPASSTGPESGPGEAPGVGVGKETQPRQAATLGATDTVKLANESDSRPFKLQQPTLDGKPAGHVVAWGKGSQNHNPSVVPAGLGQVVAISGGGYHSLALTPKGTVWAWGAGKVDRRTNGDFGQSIVPSWLDHVVAISAGWDHSLALRQDGTVVGWGHDNARKADPPADLTNAVAIAAGVNHSVALTSDGLVRVWGANGRGQADVPPGLNHVVAIASGGFHVLALRSDGTVAAWGFDNQGQAVVPAGLRNVIAIAAGAAHSAALKSDGSVVVWGGVPEVQAVPPLSGVVAIAANGNHTLALRGDGSVMAWGKNNAGQTQVPPALNHVMAISAGSLHSLALTRTMAVSARAPTAPKPKTLTATIFVAGTANPWLAGMPDGSTAAWGGRYRDTAPAQSPVQVTDIPIAPGAVLTFSATGQEANAARGRAPLFGPEGNAARVGSRRVGAQNGLADITAPIDALLGVFLDDSVPGHFEPPMPLAFRSASERDFLTLQPALRQPFFIGGGRTSAGVVRHCVAPKGATRLFLGTMDFVNWADNVGGFTVTVTRLPQLFDSSPDAAESIRP